MKLLLCYSLQGCKKNADMNVDNGASTNNSSASSGGSVFLMLVSLLRKKQNANGNRLYDQWSKEF